MATYGKWYIGSSTGSTSRGVEIDSLDICAEEMVDADWFEWNGSQMSQVEDISVRCIDDDHPINSEKYIEEGKISFTNNEDNFVQENGSERRMKNIIRSQTNSEILIARDSSLEIIENDPRDMFFILRNWNHIWHSHTTGMAIYSPTFRTQEGYEFQLKIYPQEKCLKSISKDFFVSPKFYIFN